MMLGLVGGCQDTRADICPSTVVERLLLAPQKVSVGVLVEMRGNLETNHRSKFVSAYGTLTKS